MAATLTLGATPVNLPSREFLTRKEAAHYITAHYFRLSASALAKYAMRGIGPAYQNRGPEGRGEAQYRRPDLDAWAGRHLKPAAAPKSTEQTPIVHGALSVRG